MDAIAADTVLYHATSVDRLAALAARGMDARSYWSNDEDMSDYYKETVSDEGNVPVILAVNLADLDQALLRPDREGIAEPITTVLRMSESEVRKAWEESDQDWRSSLDIIKTVRYLGAIPADKLCVIDAEDEMHLLSDYLSNMQAEDQGDDSETENPGMR